MEKLIVSCVQFAYKQIESFEDFAKNVENLLNQADGSDFVVFPETLTLELQYLIPNNNLNKIPEFTEKYRNLFARLSREKGQYIIGGSHLTIENGKEYNIGYIFCPDGKLLKHRKTHLFPLEASMGVTPGNTLEIFKTEKANIGLAICYEMEFPEVARTLTLKGVDVIFCPSYTIGEAGFWRVRHCCQARAIENQIYILHSCLVGESPHKGMEGWGRSSILSPCESPWNPNGIIAEAKTNEEMVITGELDLKVLHKKRKRGAATTLKDRRPEIYKI